MVSVSHGGSLVQALGSRSQFERHAELTDLLRSLNYDEKRRLKRLLNDDLSLKITYNCLPLELIAQVVSYLDLDDLVSILEVKANNPIEMKNWADAWYLEVCNAIAKGPFRTLAIKDGYEGFVSAISDPALGSEVVLLPDFALRYCWCGQAMQEFRNRRQGLYQPKIVSFMGSISLLAGKEYCNGRVVLGFEGGLDGSLQVLCRQSGLKLNFMTPDRSSLGRWEISDHYLIALDSSQTRIYAWRLDDVFSNGNVHAPEPISKRLPSSLRGPMMICGDKVGFVLGKTRYVWNFSNNELGGREISAHPTNINPMVLFHPSNTRIDYIVSTRDARCTSPEERGELGQAKSILTIHKYVDGQHTEEITTENILVKTWPAEVDTLKPTRTDLSGAFVVGRAGYSFPPWRFVTFDPHTETLAVTSEMAIEQYRGPGSQYRLWEGELLSDEVLSALEANFSAGVSEVVDARQRH